MKKTILAMAMMASTILTSASMTAPSFSVATAAETGFVEMENGDYSFNGIGSVTQELTDYGFDLFYYQFGFLENKALMMAESEDGAIYLYVYNKDGYLGYDTVSISTYFGPMGDFNRETVSYVEQPLSLVSFDSTLMLSKYEVMGLTYIPDTDHVIIVREIYNAENRSDDDFIFAVGFMYQYNAITHQSKVTTEEMVVVTDKMVAYQLYPQADENEIDSIYQRNYVAFSTDKEMDDLLEVKLKFDGFEYAAYTDIPLEHSASWFSGHAFTQEFATKLQNKDIYAHILPSMAYAGGRQYTDEQKTITKQNIALEYENGTWWGHTSGSWTFNTIMSTDELEATSSKDVSDYEWVVSFDNRIVGCSTFMFNNPFIGLYRSEGNIMVGTDPANDIAYLNQSAYNDSTEAMQAKLDEYFTPANRANMMLEVEDLTLLEFRFIDNGTEKTAIAVDTYTDTSGGHQIDPITLQSVWEKIQAWWAKNGKSIFTAAFVVVVMLGLVAAAPVLIPAISGFVKLIGAGLKAIGAAFKKNKKKKGK